MRSEIKYLVPTARLDELRDRLRPFLVADKHADGEQIPSYTVRSVYYDTRSLRYYREKLSGIKNREKLRIRGYNAQTAGAKVFLEIKRRYERRVAKDRVLVPLADVPALLESGDIAQYFTASDKAFVSAQKFFYHLRRHQLLPTVLVTYDREPYLCPFDSSMRVTFDKNLRSLLHPQIDDLYRDDKLLPALPGHFILEVKFNTRFPAWLRPIIMSFQLRQQSLSKYVICYESHPHIHRQSPRIAQHVAAAASIERAVFGASLA